MTRNGSDRVTLYNPWTGTAGQYEPWDGVMAWTSDRMVMSCPVCGIAVVCPLDRPMAHRECIDEALAWT